LFLFELLPEAFLFKQPITSLKILFKLSCSNTGMPPPLYASYMTTGTSVSETGICDGPAEPVASNINIIKVIASMSKCCLSRK
jgi:hypothetical protein